MASKDYDQNDNDYKDNTGAAAVERDEESRRAQEEFQAQLAKSRRAAELEREQEILKKQQEARELRQRKKEEQIEQERENAEYQKQLAIAKREQELNREQEILKKQQAARDVRQSKKSEQKQKEREIAGRAYGFTPLNPTGSKEDLEKSSFEAAENRRMWQELEEKGKVKRPHGPEEEPSSAVKLTNKIFGGLVNAGTSAKGNVKKHVQASYSDIFKVPSQPRENIGTAKEIKPSRKQSPILANLLGGVAKKRGGTPTGLLSLGPFAGSPTSLFAVKKKSEAVRRRSSSKKKVQRRTTRSTTRRNPLDDMLFF